TLVDSARRIRAEINRQYYHSVYVALGKQRRQTIDDILLTDGANRRSLWQSVKLDPGAPTLKEFRRLVERLKWLKSLRLHDPHLSVTIPPVKARHLAQEAASLDAARMLEMDSEQMRSRKGPPPDGENIKWPIFVNFVAMGQIGSILLSIKCFLLVMIIADVDR